VTIDHEIAQCDLAASSQANTGEVWKENMAATRQDWKPLETLIGVERCKDFMYMGETTNGFKQYKNRNSRNYIIIDPANGKPMEYFPSIPAWIEVDPQGGQV
jgi:hypothetical protein